MTLHKMTFAVEQPVLDRLAKLAKGQGCSKVEALRRAIIVLDWLTEELAAGNAVATITPDGTITRTKMVGMVT